MPSTRTTRRPRAASETSMDTPSIVVKKKDLSQTRSANTAQNKVEKKHEPPQDKVPVTKSKTRQAKPVAKAAAKTKSAGAKAVATRMTKAVDNGVSGSKTTLSRSVVDETFVLNGTEAAESSMEEPENSPQAVESDGSGSEREETAADNMDVTYAVTPKTAKAPLRIAVITKRQYAELDVASDSTNAFKNDPVLSDDHEVSSEEEIELAAKPASKGRKGKVAATKKAAAKKIPSDPDSDDDAFEMPTKPAMRGAKNKNTLAEIGEPSGHDNAPKVANKPTKSRAKKKDTPAEVDEPMEEASDDDAPKVISKPTKRGAKKKNTPAEPTEETSDDDAPEVVAKPTKQGARKKDTRGEIDEPTEEASDDDTAEVAKPTKKAAKKTAKKTLYRKASDVEDNLPLSDLMRQLTLDADDAPTTKDGKKKGGAGAKPKAAAKNNKKKKDAGSEPELDNCLMRYSSTESLKNITTVRGGIRHRSMSADNVNLLSVATSRPKRGAAKKLYEHESAGEEGMAAVRKTRAPRRKAAK